MRRYESRQRTPDSQGANPVPTQSKKSPTQRPTDVDRQRTPSVVSRLESLVQVVVWILAILSFVYLSFLIGFLWVTQSHHTLPLISPLTKQETLASFTNQTSDQEQDLVLKNRQELETVDDGKRIPRIIHQTYKTEKLPPSVIPFVKSWMEMNPKWTYKFYNDNDCLEFIEKEYPQYLEAYKSLPKNVERSDFFRYLVTLRYGGVYADLDTECCQSFDEFIQDTDSLIVGWEGDVPHEKARLKRHFIRRRQVLQWVFAAAPGHPVLQEVCDFIAKNAQTVFSNVSNFNTLEKTGPGIWTDVVLRHAQQDDSIRIMPRSAFGVHPNGTDGIGPDTNGLIILHHFLGSWKNKEWGKMCFFRNFFCFPKYRKDHYKTSEITMELYPVSAAFDPVFTVMVYPHSHGPVIGGSDVSVALTLRGIWQSGKADPGSPRVVDVIAGSLGHSKKNLQFLDIGTGLGIFSLAVASRNQSVIAFEPPGLGAEAFLASVRRNNFTKNVKYVSSIVDLLDVFKTSMNKTLREAGPKIGAVRIGYTGWTLWEHFNATQLIQAVNPEILVIEFSPWKMKKSNFKKPVEFLHEVFSLGFGEVYHSGELCDRRWKILAKQVQETDLEQPTWCTVMPVDFKIFLSINDHERTSPENVLFVKQTPSK